MMDEDDLNLIAERRLDAVESLQTLASTGPREHATASIALKDLGRLIEHVRDSFEREKARPSFEGLCIGDVVQYNPRMVYDSGIVVDFVNDDIDHTVTVMVYNDADRCLVEVPISQLSGSV